MIVLERTVLRKIEETAQFEDRLHPRLLFTTERSEDNTAVQQATLSIERTDR